MFASKRLSKELMKIQEHLPPGISIVKAENLEEWQMDIKVLDDNPLYQNETYRLKFTFGSKYPIEPPEVQFIECKPTSTQPQPQAQSQQSSPPQEPDTKRPIPIHPHIYSNGIICLDLLSSAGWSPVQTVESVCMSIQSMLTANSRNERPPGDSDFVSYNKRRPRDINFLYDDDNV
ncbi:ubiquitin-conjugating enzyme/RWD-like protein [Aspergillus crustosus]